MKAHLITISIVIFMIIIVAGLLLIPKIIFKCMIALILISIAYVTVYFLVEERV